MNQFLTRNSGIIVNEVVVKMFDLDEFSVCTFKGQFDKDNKYLYIRDSSLNINCGNYVKIGLATYIVNRIQQIYNDLFEIGLMECLIYYREVD